MKERNHAFDLLCGLCIVRMVALHVMNFCGHGGDEWWQGVMGWTYFFMSFFFFKAGYFNKSLAGDSCQYCADRVMRLFVPYVCCVLIGDAIYFAFLPLMLNIYHNPIEPISWSQLWRRSGAFGNPPVWFLFSFFATYIAAHFIDKVRHLRWCIVCFPFVSYWLYTQDNPLWMSLNNVFMGIFFFTLGRVWHKVMERMGKRLTLIVSALLTVFFVVGNILWHGEYTMSSNTFAGNPVFVTINLTAVLCGLSGLLIAARTPRIPWICYIGEHSMVYFISHYPILYIYKFVHLAFHRSIYGRYDDAILLLPILLCICSWLVPYVEAVPWLSGRWERLTSGRRRASDSPKCSADHGSPSAQ